MRITSAGEVGIGTTTTTQKLDVNGNIRVGDNQKVMFGPAGFEASIKYATTGEMQIAPRAGEALTFTNGENGTERMRITSGGNVQLSTAGTKILNSSGNPILQQTGSVLQVVNVTYSTTTSTSSGSYQETGLTASITPSSATSKIAVVGTINGVGTGAVDTGATVSLYRGTSSTILIVGQYFAAFSTASTNNQVNVPFVYLDSPNTTSSVTYGFAFYKSTGTGSVSVQGNTSVSSVMLMEIAA
jgi:hypothetical protein